MAVSILKHGLFYEGLKLEQDDLQPDIIYIPAPVYGGIAVNCYTDTPQFPLQVSWAPNSGGSPDTANEQVFAVLANGLTYASQRFPVDNTYRWFRCRHVGAAFGFLHSEYSDWVKAKPTWQGSGIIGRPQARRPGLPGGLQLGSAAVAPENAISRFRTRAYASGNTTISNLTDTELLWDTEDFDDGSLHSTSSNTGKIVIPSTGDISGLWWLHAQVQWANGANTGQITLSIIDSTPVTRVVSYDQLTVSGENYTQTVTAFINDPAPGTTYYVNVYQTTGVNVTVVGAQPYTSFFEAIHLW